MIHHVLEVVPLSDQRLQLRFETEEVRIFDVTPYLAKGRFGLLADDGLFRSVRVAFGTVEWPNGLDLDPEDLYEFSVPVEPQTVST